MLTLHACTTSGNNDDDQSIPEFGDRQVGGHFAAELKEMHEEALRLPDGCSAVYRFLYHRTFNNRLMIRVEHHKDGSTNVFAKELGQSGEIRRLVKDSECGWTSQQYQRFVDKIKSANFWSRPSVLQIKLRELTTDGSMWMLEGIDVHRDHFVERGSATLATNAWLKEIGVYMLKETDMLPPAKLIY